MKPLNRLNVETTSNLPIKIIQFGEGNFLRAFVDYAIDQLNAKTDFSGAVAVVQPIIHGMVDVLDKQDGLYTLFLKGISNGEIIEQHHLVTAVQQSINPFEDFESFRQLALLDSLEFVFSNTTEAGIVFDENDQYDSVPPNTFPAKLTYFLHQRYKHFSGDVSKGLHIIPCELINYNADKLKTCILQYASLWSLDSGFSNWVEQANSFHNTLVDRIVPGYPREQVSEYTKLLGYEDQLMVSAENFFLWVIEGDQALKSKLPFEKTALDVKFVPSIQPYRTRKVRVLNGIHTAMVPLCYLHGHRTVRESIDDPFTFEFIKTLAFNEIVPSVDLDKNEMEQYTLEVFDRFRNPFVVHKLESIALNSISKFSVRVLPTMLSYREKFNKIPQNCALSFAALLLFYKGNWNERALPVQDDEAVVNFFVQLWKENPTNVVVEKALANDTFWGEDLTKIEGLAHQVTHWLSLLENQGTTVAIQQCLAQTK